MKTMHYNFFWNGEANYRQPTTSEALQKYVEGLVKLQRERDEFLALAKILLEKLGGSVEIDRYQLFQIDDDEILVTKDREREIVSVKLQAKPKV